MEIDSDWYFLAIVEGLPEKLIIQQLLSLHRYKVLQFSLALMGLQTFFLDILFKLIIVRPKPNKTADMPLCFLEKSLNKKKKL